jgi:ABC-type glycerol-3-phosphate transport system permease component
VEDLLAIICPLSHSATMVVAIFHSSKLNDFLGPFIFLIDQCNWLWVCSSSAHGGTDWHYLMHTTLSLFLSSYFSRNGDLSRILTNET